MEQLPENVRRSLKYKVEEGFLDAIKYKIDDGITHQLQEMPYFLFKYILAEMEKDKFQEVLKSSEYKQFIFSNGVAFCTPLVHDQFLVTTLISPKFDIDTGLVDGSVMYVILLDLISALNSKVVGKFQFISLKEGVDEIGLGDKIQSMFDCMQQEQGGMYGDNNLKIDEN